MHKTKEGKVTASLTEVKNKTGDIFALVDQYGEVTLTSYNKPRYKIMKIDLDEIIEIESFEQFQQPKKSVFSKVKEAVIKPSQTEVPTYSAPVVEAPQIVEAPKPEGLISDAVIVQLSKMKAWEREGKDERNFVKKSLVPLQ